MIHFPRTLKAGMTIGITAPSGGVKPEFHPRLELGINFLKSRGFRVVEGNCLRSEFKHVSGTKEERADDFMQLWADPAVDMIFPPWGGELIMEILPLLDFEKMKLSPKWILGYSDTSTLLLAISTLTDIATAHGSNLIDSIPSQVDSLTSQALDSLATPLHGSFSQNSSKAWQKTWTDLKKFPDLPFHLTEKTLWKSSNTKPGPIEFSGRLIGGCLDTLASLTGTRFGDVASFAHRYRNDRTILFFENCQQTPTSMARIIWNFRFAGWFENCAGVVFGRSAAPEVSSLDSLRYEEALERTLADLDIPVIYDVDIGHMPPQMTLINGALASFSMDGGRAVVKQKFIP